MTASPYRPLALGATALGRSLCRCRCRLRRDGRSSFSRRCDLGLDFLFGSRRLIEELVHLIGGRVKRIDGVQDRYIEFAKRTLPRDLSLDGLRVVVDCAHGAAYKVAPDALWELGAEVIAMGVEPDGFNIN